MSTWQQSDFGDRGELDMAIGPVRGVRWWTTNGVGLIGMFGGAWGTDENVATCRKDWNPVTNVVTNWVKGHGLMVSARWLSSWEPTQPAPQHPAPDDGCTCGFYAFWQHEVLPIGDQYPLIGVIEGYGRTVIGSRGFRSERARILGLHAPTMVFGDYYNQWNPKDHPRILHALGERYGVPIYSSLHKLLANHPPTTDYAGLPTAG